MKIIIAGIGKLGEYLAKELSDDGNDVVIIDEKTINKRDIVNNEDVFYINGNALDSNVLLEAGITNSDFIKSALDARLDKDKHVSLFRFIKDMDKAVSDLKMNPDLPHRYINEGFSGGEKKRNEILQMKMLKPHFAILDEIDSGLDVDALRIVGENVNDMKSDTFASLVITHYQRLLDYIKVTHVHIMLDGRIVKSGGVELIEKIDNEGYDWIKEELGIVTEATHKQSLSLGSCALNPKERK